MQSPECMVLINCTVPIAWCSQRSTLGLRPRAPSVGHRARGPAHFPPVTLRAVQGSSRQWPMGTAKRRVELHPRTPNLWAAMSHGVQMFSSSLRGCQHRDRAKLISPVALASPQGLGAAPCQRGTVPGPQLCHSNPIPGPPGHLCPRMGMKGPTPGERETPRRALVLPVAPACCRHFIPRLPRSCPEPPGAMAEQSPK